MVIQPGVGACCTARPARLKPALIEGKIRNPTPSTCNLESLTKKKYGSKGDLQDPKMEILKWPLNRVITDVQWTSG
jgi:hypothetical protein